MCIKKLFCAILGGTSGKESTCQCRRHKGRGSNLWFRKIPWSRKWQPTPVFLLREFQEQRSLVGFSPWDPKESCDMTEHTAHFFSFRYRLPQVYQ